MAFLKEAILARVLVVEDEEPIRRLFKEALVGASHEVIEASSGQEGLKASVDHKGEIDLVLTDLSMPGFTGIEMLSAMTEVGFSPPRAIVVSGGFTRPETMEECRQSLSKIVALEVSGALHDFMLKAKPISPAKIVESVAAFMAIPY